MCDASGSARARGLFAAKLNSGPGASSVSHTPSRPPVPSSGLSGWPLGKDGGGGKRASYVAVVTMKQLLESGVHFGHQARRWNPKMKRFIFMERNGIHIIDLQQTLTRVEEAYAF